ncbi:hypothetical protein R84B8_01535 [Treponema sp. R8-4-B8]
MDIAAVFVYDVTIFVIVGIGLAQGTVNHVIHCFFNVDVIRSNHDTLYVVTHFVGVIHQFGIFGVHPWEIVPGDVHSAVTTDILS